MNTLLPIMTAEHAAMVLRRAPLSPWDRALRIVAVRTLAAHGYDRRAIEITGMTTLNGDEVAAMGGGD